MDEYKKQFDEFQLDEYKSNVSFQVQTELKQKYEVKTLVNDNGDIQLLDTEFSHAQLV